MKAIRAHCALSVSALLGTSLLLLGCSAYSGSTSEAASPSLDCDELFDAVIHGVRTDGVSDAFNELVGNLERDCPSQMRVAIDYFSLAATSGSEVLDVCEAIERTNPDPRAVELINEDGHCLGDLGTGSGFTAAPSDPDISGGPGALWPNEGLGWDQADQYVGTYQRVCGPFKSMRSTADGLFINVGLDYPSMGRFTFIIWGDWWMDPIDPQSTVCAAGDVYNYEGVAQMELGDPSQIEIWN